MNSMANFRKALDYEKSRMPLADKYYTEKWRALGITRYSWENLEDREKQCKDIDCYVELQENEGIYVSEKFRSKDYGTVFLELVDNGHDGWTIRTEADKICFFVKNKTVYEVNAKDLKRLACELKEQLSAEIEEVSKVASGKVNSFYHGKNVRLFRIDSYNTTTTWNAICAAIRWSDLQKLGIRFTVNSL